MKQLGGALTQPKPPPVWLKRLGVGGFLFFLIKGALWLMVPALLATLGVD